MKAKSYSNYDCWVLVRKVKSDKKNVKKFEKKKLPFMALSGIKVTYR